MRYLLFLLVSVPLLYAQSNSDDGLAIQWYSQGEQAAPASWSNNYFASICPATGLDGAQCVFTANLQDQPWEPQFDNWCQVTLVSSSGATIITNSQSLLYNLSFTYSDTYGNITAQIVWGNSDGLIFSFVLRCIPPDNTLGLKALTNVTSAVVREQYKPRLIPTNVPVTYPLAQYATILEASLANSAFLEIPVAFCFDMTQQQSTILVAVSAQDSSTNMVMYVCPDTPADQCTPGVATYFDTSASGFLSIVMTLQQAQYGVFTIIVKCLGSWLGICHFSVNARLSS